MPEQYRHSVWEAANRHGRALLIRASEDAQVIYAVRSSLGDWKRPFDVELFYEDSTDGSIKEFDRLYAGRCMYVTHDWIEGHADCIYVARAH